MGNKNNHQQKQNKEMQQKQNKLFLVMDDVKYVTNKSDDAYERTKLLQEVYTVNETVIDDIFDRKIKEKINCAFDKMYLIETALKEELNKTEYIKINNKALYFFKEGYLVPDLEKYKPQTKTSYYSMSRDGTPNLNFSGYKGIFPDEKLARKIKSKFKLDSIAYETGTDSYRWFFKSDSGVFSCSTWHDINIIPVAKPKNLVNNYYLPMFLDQQLIPQMIVENDELNQIFENLLNLYRDKYFSFVFEMPNDLSYVVSDKFYDEVLSGKIKDMNGVRFTVDWNKENIIADEFVYNLLANELLECDLKRADIEKYDKKWLDDPNMGHWDLWNCDNKGIKITLKDKIVARNPVADIRENGLIGIDFGTKSTIVVCQDGDDNIQPMRVGIGRFSNKVETKHYENPTVMEFRDLQSFIEAYDSKIGRPNTEWEMMAVSHTALNNLNGSNESKNYYAFFHDLKQWAGDKNARFRIKDKEDFEFDLKPYLTLKDGDFDPIEYYAYYLGLYINNMHNGIYLDYLLSFPVTYEVAVREKILNSFSKGLKKSLPETILKNDDVMKKFRVVQGASEPAAYAICALEQYGFDPDEDENVFYGIFDFGGGTTDFDFGIWRSATEDEDRYDYVISHFGSGGDKYLGGENLLRLLAYHVFVENQDALRNNKIVFQKPEGCKRFPGSEVLVNESQEAKLNIQQLAEQLRPLWERTEDYEEKYQTGEIKLTLFSSEGVILPNTALNIDVNKLNEILTERIDQGVRNFFESLRQSFVYHEDLLHNVNEIHIFLAGNSSKSPIVKELFNKYIDEKSKEINKLTGEDDKLYYHVYPPLGTDEAKELQRNRNIIVDESDVTIPTGKTGVAFGLIEGRTGGIIKVISEDNTSTDEIKFAYYIGRNRKKKFKMVLSRETKYNEWVKFISADEQNFELYVSDLPEAATGELPINSARKIKCMIDVVNSNAAVYIRAVAPTKIEYVVAFEDSIKSNSYLSKIIEKDLQE